MSSETLSDDEVAELCARPSTELGGYRRVLLRPRERDALCATVRALREKHTQLAEVSGEWAKLLDRIRLWSKCADGYPLDEHINNISTQLAQVTQEPLAATIDILEQRRRQLGAESIPEYARTINFLQALIDEKKKEYPPLRAARSNHE